LRFSWVALVSIASSWFLWSSVLLFLVSLVCLLVRLDKAAFLVWLISTSSFSSLSSLVLDEFEVLFWFFIVFFDDAGFWLALTVSFRSSSLLLISFSYPLLSFAWSWISDPEGIFLLPWVFQSSCVISAVEFSCILLPFFSVLTFTPVWFFLVLRFSWVALVSIASSWFLWSLVLLFLVSLVCLLVRLDKAAFLVWIISTSSFSSLSSLVLDELVVLFWCFLLFFDNAGFAWSRISDPGGIFLLPWVFESSCVISAVEFSCSLLPFFSVWTFTPVCSFLVLRFSWVALVSITSSWFLWSSVLLFLISLVCLLGRLDSLFSFSLLICSLPLGDFFKLVGIFNFKFFIPLSRVFLHFSWLWISSWTQTPVQNPIDNPPMYWMICSFFSITESIAFLNLIITITELKN